MTNEQKFQVAAMNASGMSIDEIALDTKLDRQEVEDLVKERNDKRKTISEATKRAVVEWYQSGNTEKQCAKKFGISPASAHRIIAAAKEKEPTAAATATDSKVKTLQVKDTTVSAESQALRGVEVIGLMQTMLIGIEENFGDNVEVMSLRADSDTASIVFRYDGKAYSVQFGLAF
ncbi:helix-turn-helix domain-containing protein [uncultured Ruminococcus sp.]|uniref:helix-turn-helix domain-containing protein n=1 Tax=uncultured Ruminococcus sp. TaxID=165186 RepID=UPI0025D3374E|nr:helix-turn-helix domain-containing protein [uncultured Ruminococcus sp.]